MPAERVRRKREGKSVNDQPDRENADRGSRVAELLGEQRDLYRELSRLSDKQRRFITGEEPGELLTVLVERQRLIDRLTGVGRELKPLLAGWQELRGRLDAGQARTIDGLVREVKVLLSEIMRKDEADSALLSARKSQTGRNIENLQAGRQAGAAYAASSSVSSHGADWADA